jgi:hypothetical protein
MSKCFVSTSSEFNNSVFDSRGLFFGGYCPLFCESLCLGIVVIFLPFLFRNSKHKKGDIMEKGMKKNLTCEKLLFTIGNYYRKGKLCNYE